MRYKGFVLRMKPHRPQYFLDETEFAKVSDVYYDEQRDELVWVTRDGQHIDVREMDYVHLTNALNMMKKKMNEYAEAVMNEERSYVMYLNAVVLVLERERFSRREFGRTNRLIQVWKVRHGVQEEEAVKLLKGGVDVWSTALELRMG